MKTGGIYIVLAVAFGSAALAQPNLDADGDGAVSLQEFQDAHSAHAAERFGRLDENGDGQLSADEMSAAHGRGEGRGRDAHGDGRGMGRGFERLDTDGDGSLSLAELQARHPEASPLFAEIDSDADGLLTREEWTSGREAMHEWWQERMNSIDSDGDGAWSLAELQAVRPNLDPERFARMDRDGDGLITADERPGRGRHEGDSRH
jgi:Ca2+-binding EF-hand superfamily protein